MSETIVGLFDEDMGARSLPCGGACDNCCGNAFADMPDVIYCRIKVTDPAVDIYTPLYRFPGLSSVCTCGAKVVGSAFWVSPLFYIAEGAATDFTVCCGSLTLSGVCSGDTCIWTLEYCNPVRAENGVTLPCITFTPVVDATTGDRITCGTIEGVISSYSEYHAGNDCLHPHFVFVLTELTISQSIPGGTAASACDKLCCGMPLRVYVTLASDDCPTINGQVVTLTLSYVGGKFWSAGLPKNPGGEHKVVWVGWLNACGCCPIPVYVTANTWSHHNNPLDQCRWSIRIGTEHDTCFESTIFENTNTSPCPPDIEFSGTLLADGQCSNCCHGEVEITAEVDF